MLYNPQLITFMTAAETGSFSKTARQGYISTTAVIKQINSLEADLGFSLFVRSNHGLKLTDAGESLYHDVKKIVQLSEKALEKAKKAEEKDLIIKIGVSPFNPSSYIGEILPELEKNCPDLRFEMVQFRNTLNDVTELLRNLGNDIDIVFGACSRDLFGVPGVQGLIIERFPMPVAVPARNPLSRKKIIRLADLKGQTLYILKRGSLSSVDRVRNYVETEYPEIRIADSEFYDLEGFNVCAQNNWILLMITDGNVHPLMKVCRIDWDFETEFGAIYSENCSGNVARVLNSLRKLYPDSYEICR